VQPLKLSLLGVQVKLIKQASARPCFLGVALIFSVFAHLPSEEKWNRLFSIVGCCLGMPTVSARERENQGTLSHIATCFGEVFQGGAVPAHPGFLQLTPRLLSSIETNINQHVKNRFQTLLSSATCATTPRGGSGAE